MTPLRLQNWLSVMKEYPDAQFANYIETGIKQGFWIRFQYGSVRCISTKANAKSASLHPGSITRYLNEELKEGRIAGPFPMALLPEVQCNKLGVIPKSTPSEWRLILDLSFPRQHSVNDGIPKELCSLQYPTVDEAIGHILRLGKGGLLAKADIKHAYRNIPIHPQDRHLLGMQWEGELYIDMVLPFGFRSAPKIFTAVADMAEWIMIRRGVSWCLHYIDDFLTAGRAGTPECANNLQVLIATCDYLGFPLKSHKLEGPTPVLPFLGIVLDTVREEITLPEEKLSELIKLIKYWLGLHNCKKRNLLSLIGKLSHACKVVQVGRIFLRRMIDLASKTKQLDHWVHHNSVFSADLLWWDTFQSLWNGRSMFEVHNPIWQLHITFSSWGCGAIWNNGMQVQWETHWLELNVAIKELLPITLACAIWGSHWGRDNSSCSRDHQ